jgi:hypothetical protein
MVVAAAAAAGALGSWGLADFKSTSAMVGTALWVCGWVGGWMGGRVWRRG